MDNYEKVLEIVGDLCGGLIADNAGRVDHQGASWNYGRAIYADGTVQKPRSLPQSRPDGHVHASRVTEALTSPSHPTSWLPI